METGRYVFLTNYCCSFGSSGFLYKLLKACVSFLHIFSKQLLYSCFMPLLFFPGGTAVGTGLNTKKGFAEKAAAKLAESTGRYAHRSIHNHIALCQKLRQAKGKITLITIMSVSNAKICFNNLLFIQRIAM